MWLLIGLLIVSFIFCDTGLLQYYSCFLLLPSCKFHSLSKIQSKIIFPKDFFILTIFYGEKKIKKKVLKHERIGKNLPKETYK